jgi:hypothetical protein
VHSSKISDALIDEYEKFTGVISESKYQVISHSIVGNRDVPSVMGEPPSKRRREDWDLGYVLRVHAVSEA